MTFKYKLSVRLALLKDLSLLLPVLALFGCEKPAGVSGPSAVVSKVVVSPQQIALLPNQTSHFTAVALTATGDTTSVAVTWSATGGTIVDTFTAGSHHYATYQPSTVPGNYLVIATDPPDAGFADTSTVTVLSVPVASVALSPALASMLVGAAVQLTAIPQDASGVPLAGRSVTWASSAPAVATVSSSGLVTATAVGAATITATSEGKSATAAITVTTVPVASLTVSPASANVAVGATAQLTATAKDSIGNQLNGRVVTWSSSAPGVATVTGSGLVSAVAAGSATITATSEGKSAASAVTATFVPVASVTVSPASASILASATQQLTAVTKDSVGTTLVGRVITWSSGNTSVATVSAGGLVAALAAGTATITAASEGKSGTAAVTVTAPAPGKFVVGDPVLTTSPATVRNAPALSGTSLGVQPAGSLGTVAGGPVVDATGDGLTRWQINFVQAPSGWVAEEYLTKSVPVASVTVNPASGTISVGATQQLVADTKDAAGNTIAGHIVSWSSSNTLVASVSSSGVVTGQAAGSATITATSEGKSGTSAMTVQAPPPGTHAGYYVTPNGSSSGAGSVSSPWSLSYALGGAGGRVQPGDTVWLRGGTYSGVFSSGLNGTATSPIVVRQYPGERATIDGGLNSITGSYTWYWGFEVMRSVGVGTNIGGVDEFGYNNRLINLVVHDASGVGIGSNDANQGGEITGCLVYNNGHLFNFNHGMYIHNPVGAPLKTLRDNIVFNNWTNNIQVFATASGYLDNVVLDGNVMFGAASISLPTNKAADGLILGPGARRMQVTNNYTYEVPSSQNVALWIGDHADDQDIMVTGNVLVGGANKGMNMGPWATATVSRNMLYTRGGEVILTQSPMGGYTWTQNVHYRDLTATSWNHNGTDYTYSAWKGASALGGSDANSGTNPTGVQVFVRPNAYEAGRANIIIYNWDNALAVNVDLSGVLAPGQSYSIVNAQNFFGAAVASGTYNGGLVSLPMTGITPAQPIGRSFTTPPVTGPTFQVFVVRLLGA